MHSILTEIVEYKRKSVEQRKKLFPLNVLEDKIKHLPKCRSFKNAISSKSRVNIIAEIKCASPSKGILRADFHPGEISKIYTSSGAAAISVLTEEHYFKGDIGHIALVKENTNLPILRKDFIIDPYQIYEARAFGADAALLIASLLLPAEIENFIEIASLVGLDSLVEIHDEADLEKILPLSCGIIGINNRNLNDFSVDLKTGMNILSHLPKDKIAVIESGIKTRSDIEIFKAMGANSFLIGETFMRSSDIRKTISGLI